MCLCLLLGGALSVYAADLKPIEACFRTGQYAQCAELAVAAIADKEPTERCRVLLISARLELGQYPQAAVDLADAQKAFPQSLVLRWIGRDVARFTGKPERAGELEEEIVQLLRQSAWRYGDPDSRIVLGKLLLRQGLEPKRILEGTYNAIKKVQPDYVPVWIATGELALEKNDFALAAENFERAAKLDPENPEAHFGLARAFAPGDPPKAEEYLKKALEINPHHVGCLLMAAEYAIDSEDYANAEKLLDDVESVNPLQPLSLTYRAVLAFLRNQEQRAEKYHDAALAHWFSNPEVDYTFGKKLSQKYRFADGAAAQRRALICDPSYLPAKSQLSQDLLRLGREDEGWKLAAEVYAADGYNVFAHNLVTLQETIAKFRTIAEDGIELRMDRREADIYGDRVMALLRRAKRELCQKYEVELPAPIIVEMFPRQQDFAIRTFGLPGGAGFLGVCFGTVITANSPASQADRPTCWEATLWHEFCHVVTLNKTKNRMPRWLSEGISVYEERLADPTWGQTMTPRYRKMLLGDDFVPVSRLSAAFLRPESPIHLQFAYFEASLVIEFLIDQFGSSALNQLLADLGHGMEINDALGRYAGGIESLDQQFADYARGVANQFAPDADWSEPEVPAKADARLLQKWLDDHPKNYPALSRLARKLIEDKQWDRASNVLQQMQAIWPQDPTDDGLYGMQAKVARELMQSPAEIAALNSLAGLNNTSVSTMSRLIELLIAQNDWPQVRRQANRWLAVNPLMPTPHRYLAQAGEAMGDDESTCLGLTALLKLDPLDPPDLFLRLGQARLRQGDVAAARRSALLALEKTPRFRAAQKLLLEIDLQSGRPPEPPLPSQVMP